MSSTPQNAKWLLVHTSFLYINPQIIDFRKMLHFVHGFPFSWHMAEMHHEPSITQGEKQDVLNIHLGKILEVLSFNLN